MTTMFSLIGRSPAASAASMPAMVLAKASTRAISWKRSMCSVSSEMLMRLSPASASRCALLPKSTPLVVIVMSRSGRSDATMPTSSSMLARTSGSPPVIRIVRTP